MSIYIPEFWVGFIVGFGVGVAGILLLAWWATRRKAGDVGRL